jgi:hypothetical protein
MEIGLIDINLALRRASRRLAGSIPGLAHVAPKRLLFVFNPALRTARARILPLCFDSTALPVSRDGKRRRPIVRYRGVRVLYVVEYGRSFMRATPVSRLETLVHELLHTSPFFNGTLSRKYRHSRTSPPEFRRAVEEMLGRMDRRAVGAVLEGLDFGDVRMVLKWRTGFSLSSGGAFSEKDLSAATMLSRC